MSFGGERRGFRISPRLVIALVIAAISVISYFANTAVNPVTGEKQHVALSVQEEKVLGLQAAPEMADRMGGALDPRQDRGARLVQQVGRKVLERSAAANSEYADNFHFFLLDDPQTVNAFALPGGQVFITRALLGRLDDEAELAGVLGHEIGHVIGRHAAEHMATGQLGQSLVAAVAVGASDDRGGGRQAAMAASLVNGMFQLRYGRDDETEADSLGLRFMAEAGYDPSAMLDVMEVLKDAGGGGGRPEFLSTHPYPETRVEQIRNYLTETYPDGIPSDLTRGRSLGSSGVSVGLR